MAFGVDKALGLPEAMRLAINEVKFKQGETYERLRRIGRR
jgi:hypothetical protein